MPNLAKKVSCREGFTLIELIVVFSIMAMISGVGFASLVAYSRSQALSQAVANVKSAVEQAKFNALSNVVRPSSCTTTSTLVSYKLIFCGTNAACTAEGITDTHGYLIQVNCGVQSTTIFRQKVLSPLSVSSTCANVTYLATNANFSSSSSPPCTVTVSGYGNTKQVIINSLGQTQ